MKIKRLIFAAGMILLVGGIASAKPAMKGVRTVVQPDGTQLRIEVVGDEHLHFTTTEDGRLLHLDSDGFYKLGKIDVDGAVVSTGISINDRSADVSAVILKDLDINSIMKKRKGARKAPQSNMGLFPSHTYPISGSPKALIILVEYSDVKFQTPNAKEYFEEMINGENFTQYGGTGSALKYFEDQSGGKFTPEFDVLGPVTLPQKRSYYGQNDRWGEDQHPEQMVQHAIQILDPDVDFSIYDTDKDGIIDNVYVFYAGQGEADYGSADTVWPHSWDFDSAGIRQVVDGVRVNQYACSNEWDETRPGGIGTFIHEFSHVMGLPDLYHTSDSYARYTPDEYSVLDYGPYNNDGRTPPNYGAYEKNALGWYEPVMLDGPVSVELKEISSGQFGLIPTSKATEFFLLENRQLTGWDKYIPNHGLLIWHIDYVADKFENNVVNNNQYHQYVDIVEANNNPDFDNTKDYTFPGTTGKTSFTSSTTPALKDWNGRAIDLPVTDIAEKDGVISFDIAGGGVTLDVPDPSVTEWTAEKGYFWITWPPVEGATEYYLSVYAGEGGKAGISSTGFDGKQIPSGWTADLEDWYETNSNYGESSPSYKFKNDGQKLTSAQTPGEITKIEFWAKGQSSDGTTLRIEGLKKDSWILIDDYTPLKSKSETVEIDVPSGINQIRFVMSKSTGNIAVDDIVLFYGGDLEVLPDYDNISVGNVTEFKVDKLIEGVKDYKFTVSATDGKKIRTSSLVSFSLQGVSTGIGDVSLEDRTSEYFNLQGVKITNPSKGSIVIERCGSSVRKIIVK